MYDSLYLEQSLAFGVFSALLPAVRFVTDNLLIMLYLHVLLLIIAVFYVSFY